KLAQSHRSLYGGPESHAASCRASRTLRHAARVERDDLLIEAVEAGLVLLDELRLELRVAITRHVNLDLAALAAQGLRGGAVARVARRVSTQRVLFVAEVVSQLAVQGAFNQGFGELLQQPVLTEQVI